MRKILSIAVKITIKIALLLSDLDKRLLAKKIRPNC